jgi:hypothetical protein
MWFSAPLPLLLMAANLGVFFGAGIVLRASIEFARH